jgi:hypothetical protein
MLDRTPLRYNRIRVRRNQPNLCGQIAHLRLEVVVDEQGVDRVLFDDLFD